MQERNNRVKKKRIIHQGLLVSHFMIELIDIHHGISRLLHSAPCGLLHETTQIAKGGPNQTIDYHAHILMH